MTVEGKVPPLAPHVKGPSLCSKADIPNEILVVDSKTAGLRNVIIWLSHKPASIHPESVAKDGSEIVVRQKGCQYVPHVSFIQTNQSVRIHNDDPFAHSPQTYPLRNNQHTFTVPPLGNQVLTFKEPEKLPAKIGSNLHPWMQAWWLVLDHPYAAITNETGEFEIQNLPIGNVEFRVWHEKVGYVEKSFKVTVVEGDNKLAPIIVKAETLTK